MSFNEYGAELLETPLIQITYNYLYSNPIQYSLYITYKKISLIKCITKKIDLV